ncbi:hypothetical protein RJ639_009367 [Escallonia herrerae]|uniref:RING-type domain-containing protein n=1 Tax=Escallonia herrerae TaxID=1293975 RepID=A0AA88VSX0_9ASTE|nr:hypothetical protein RJ639_009367 [Escallonia herrerae]
MPPAVTAPSAFPSSSRTAFHSGCIDTWLAANQTCPLCRSTVHPTEADVLNKLVSESEARILGNSFRIEIWSVSQRRAPSKSGWRSYSLGSFDYIVDEGYEVLVGSTHRRGASDCTEKDSAGAPISQLKPPGEILVAEVAGGQSWLRDYVHKISAISFFSRAMSFRISGRFFTGSSRRSENAIVSTGEDVEANRKLKALNPNKRSSILSLLFFKIWKFKKRYYDR